MRHLFELIGTDGNFAASAGFCRRGVGCRRGLSLTKSQYAKPNPAIVPRKLRESVCVTVKQGWIDAPGNEAQIESLCTLTVPTGSPMTRVGPKPPGSIVPTTDPSALMRPPPVVPSKHL
jgi:hypothetical protein